MCGDGNQICHMTLHLVRLLGYSTFTTPCFALLCCALLCVALITFDLLGFGLRVLLCCCLWHTRSGSHRAAACGTLGSGRHPREMIRWIRSPIFALRRRGLYVLLHPPQWVAGTRRTHHNVVILGASCMLQSTPIPRFFAANTSGLRRNLFG